MASSPTPLSGDFSIPFAGFFPFSNDCSVMRVSVSFLPSIFGPPAGAHPQIRGFDSTTRFPASTAVPSAALTCAVVRSEQASDACEWPLGSLGAYAPRSIVTVANAAIVVERMTGPLVRDDENYPKCHGGVKQAGQGAGVVARPRTAPAC